MADSLDSIIACVLSPNDEFDTSSRELGVNARVTSSPLPSMVIGADAIISDTMASSSNIIASSCTSVCIICIISTGLRLTDELMTDCIGAVILTTCLSGKLVLHRLLELMFTILFLFGGRTRISLNGNGRLTLGFVVDASVILTWVDDRSFRKLGIFGRGHTLRPLSSSTC